MHDRPRPLRRPRRERGIRIVLDIQLFGFRVVVPREARREDERKVEPGGDASPGDPVAILHHPRLDRGRPKLGKEVVGEPVRGRPVTREQSGRTEDQRARADARDVAGAGRARPQEGEEFLVLHRGDRANGAPGQEQHIEVARALRERGGGEHHPAPGRDLLLRLPDEVDLCVEQVGEHRQGTQQVKREHPGIGDHRDLSWPGWRDRLLHLRVPLREVVDEAGHHLHHGILLQGQDRGGRRRIVGATQRWREGAGRDASGELSVKIPAVHG